MNRTRAWEKPEGCSGTVVQFRTDVPERMWVLSNMGWYNCDVSELSEAQAEEACVRLASHFGLVEVDEARATWLAGWED